VATRRGYYGLRRIREEDKFDIGVGEFSAAWMEPAGHIPAEFTDEVATKTEAFESRPTATELRQKADSAASSSLKNAVAEGVAQGVGAALAAQRQQHEDLRRAAGSPAEPVKADAGSKK
jgi:hypothetical protein